MLHLLSDVLFGQYRRRVLGLLLLHPATAYHVREIARLTGTAPGTLHKELTKLHGAGILSRERLGQQLFYRADRSSPVFEELASIMRKTSGLGDVLAEALTPHVNNIDLAFVYGSMARGEDTPTSDVDVMVIGEVSFADVVRALYAAQETVGREINPKVLTRSQWRDGIAQGEPFLRDVMSKPKIFVIGNDSDLEKLGRD